MIQFWLDNFMELFNVDNLKFTKSKPDSKIENYIKILNLVAIISIITGLSMVFLTKNIVYFGMIIVVMSFTILIKSNLKVNAFTNVKLSNSFQTGTLFNKQQIGSKFLRGQFVDRLKMGLILNLTNCYEY